MADKLNWNRWKDYRIRAMNEAVDNEYTGTIEVSCSDREVFDRVVDLLKQISSMTQAGASRSIVAHDGYSVEAKFVKGISFDGDGSDKIISVNAT